MSRNPTPPNPSGPPGRVPPRPAAAPAGTPPARPAAAGGVARPAAAGSPGSVVPRSAPVMPVAKATAPATQPVPVRKPVSETPVASTESTALATKYADTGDIVARGSGDYRGRRYLMVVLLVGMGIWFAYDGFKGWPDENRKIQELSDKISKATHEPDQEKAKETIRELDRDPLAHKPPHSPTDLFVQKMLAFLLPGIGAATLVWALYNSRGEYRLSGKMLSVPGHPNVALDSIIAIDRKEWDRKGIAYVEYREREGETVAFDLDDFIYQRDETDKIFDILEAHVARGKKGGAEA